MASVLADPMGLLGILPLANAGFKKTLGVSDGYQWQPRTCGHARRMVPAYWCRGGSMNCPHCDKPFSVTMVAKANAESRMQFSMSPASGEYLAASNVGGVIEQMSKFLKAVGTDMNVPTEVLVERVETDDAGKITVHLIIARFDHPHGPEQRSARLKRRRGAEVRRD